MGKDEEGGRMRKGRLPVLVSAPLFHGLSGENVEGVEKRHQLFIIGVEVVLIVTKRCVHCPVPFIVQFVLLV